MKFFLRFSGISLVAVLTILTSGCAQSPSEVLFALEAAAQAGDAEAFAQHFTSDSRPFAEALLRIQKDVRKGEPAKAPIQNLFQSRVLSETINGNTAVVRISGPTGPDVIAFVREHGKWKLDVTATEQSVNQFDGTVE